MVSVDSDIGDSWNLKAFNYLQYIPTGLLSQGFISEDVPHFSRGVFHNLSSLVFHLWSLVSGLSSLVFPLWSLVPVSRLSSLVLRLLSGDPHFSRKSLVDNGIHRDIQHTSILLDFIFRRIRGTMASPRLFYGEFSAAAYT